MSRHARSYSRSGWEIGVAVGRLPGRKESSSVEGRAEEVGVLKSGYQGKEMPSCDVY